MIARVLLALLGIYFLFQCTSKKKEVRNTLKSETINQYKEIEPAPQQTLEDSILQIREWFNIINTNTNNYLKESYEVKTDSFRISIVELNDRYEKERQKVIYQSNEGKYDLPSVDEPDHITSIIREYFYWNKSLFFVYEILEMEVDSTKQRHENRYYLDRNGRMIRWINGKNMMAKGDSVYKAVETALTLNSDHLLHPYNYFKEYNFLSKLEANSKDRLKDFFFEVLFLRHNGADSVKTLYVDQFDSKFVIEVYYSGDSYLYVLKANKQESLWTGTERLIGKLPKHINQIETPGEFYYYLMDLQRNRDTLRLRELIPDQGYKTDVIVAIGDVAEPQYEHHLVVSKETIDFKDLDFDFSPSLFNFHENIDENFNEEGEASISHWGGGFSEGVKIKKVKDKVYLQSHSSSDH